MGSEAIGEARGSVAQAILPVPAYERDAMWARQARTKNALFDLACLARVMLRFHWGTGRIACATERRTTRRFAVGARHAVPGERAWRDPAIHRGGRIER